MPDKQELLVKVFDFAGVNLEGLFAKGTPGAKEVYKAIAYVEAHEMQLGSQRDLILATKAFWAGLNMGIERTSDILQGVLDKISPDN